MRRLVPVLIVFCACAPVLLTAQLTTPTDWKWRQDSHAPLAARSKMEPGSWVFVQMPPGWHVTTGPGVLLYPAANGDIGGNYSLEAEIFLFPQGRDGGPAQDGEVADEYGLFLGGQDIDASATPTTQRSCCAGTVRRRSFAGARARRHRSPPGNATKPSFGEMS